MVVVTIEPIDLINIIMELAKIMFLMRYAFLISLLHRMLMIFRKLTSHMF